MKFFVKHCILITLCGPLFCLFMAMIATGGDDAADELVEVIGTWLHE